VRNFRKKVIKTRKKFPKTVNKMRKKILPVEMKKLKKIRKEMSDGTNFMTDSECLLSVWRSCRLIIYF
jgi:uncharacterized membrane protein (DUF106 family)